MRWLSARPNKFARPVMVLAATLLAAVASQREIEAQRSC